MVIALLVTTDVLAGAKTYGEKKGYTWEQQIRRGEREKPNLVTCLLYTSPSPRDA